jgi:hypothetical protein
VLPADPLLLNGALGVHPLPKGGGYVGKAACGPHGASFPPSCSAVQETARTALQCRRNGNHGRITGQDGWAGKMSLRPCLLELSFGNVHDMQEPFVAAGCAHSNTLSMRRDIPQGQRESSAYGKAPSDQ